MSAAPTVSVLMPVRNAGRFLDAAIGSIRAQTLEAWEMLVCDDGSDDGSGDKLAAWSATDPRIRVIPLPAPVGIANALNILADHARAALIARMDADDTCAPTRFEKQVEFLRLHPGHVAVSVGTLCVDPDGRPIAPLPQCDIPEELDGNLFHRDGPGICHPAIMFRKDAFVRAGRYRAKYCYVEDTDLWLRMLPLGKFGVIHETLFHYRQHVQSVCRQRGQEQRSLGMLMTEEIRDTRLRTGVPVPPARTRPVAPPECPSGGDNPHDLYRNWAANATRAGYRRTALHWAFVVWRTAPLNRSDWWLVLEALTGIRTGRCIKKIYAACKRAVCGRTISEAPGR